MLDTNFLSQVRQCYVDLHINDIMNEKEMSSKCDRKALYTDLKYK